MQPNSIFTVGRFLIRDVFVQVGTSSRECSCVCRRMDESQTRKHPFSPIFIFLQRNRIWVVVPAIGGKILKRDFRWNNDVFGKSKPLDSRDGLRRERERIDAMHKFCLIESSTHPLTMAIIMDHELTLSKPTPQDFHALSVLQHAAFPEQDQKNNLRRYERYYKECPAKLDHCRVVKMRNNSSESQVIAACQLQLRAGRDDGIVDVFIEWIGCHPDHRGKGVGSMLLDWAGRFAKESLKSNTLGLYMIRSNTNARRLYERNGFAKSTSSSSGKTKDKQFQRRIDRWFGHGSAIQMEKRLL